MIKKIALLALISYGPLIWSSQLGSILYRYERSPQPGSPQTQQDAPLKGLQATLLTHAKNNEFVAANAVVKRAFDDYLTDANKHDFIQPLIEAYIESFRNGNAAAKAGLELFENWLAIVDVDSQTLLALEPKVKGLNQLEALLTTHKTSGKSTSIKEKKVAAAGNATATASVPVSPASNATPEQGGFRQRLANSFRNIKSWWSSPSVLEEEAAETDEPAATAAGTDSAATVAKPADTDSATAEAKQPDTTETSTKKADDASSSSSSGDGDDSSSSSSDTDSPAKVLKAKAAVEVAEKERLAAIALAEKAANDLKALKDKLALLKGDSKAPAADASAATPSKPAADSKTNATPNATPDKEAVRAKALEIIEKTKKAKADAQAKAELEAKAKADEEAAKAKAEARAKAAEIVKKQRALKDANTKAKEAEEAQADLIRAQRENQEAQAELKRLAAEEEELKKSTPDKKPSNKNASKKKEKKNEKKDK